MASLTPDPQNPMAEQPPMEVDSEDATMEQDEEVVLDLMSEYYRMDNDNEGESGRQDDTPTPTPASKTSILRSCSTGILQPHNTPADSLESESEQSNYSTASDLEHASQEFSLTHQKNSTEPPTNPLLNPTPSTPTSGSQSFSFGIRRKRADVEPSDKNLIVDSDYSKIGQGSSSKRLIVEKESDHSKKLRLMLENNEAKWKRRMQVQIDASEKRWLARLAETTKQMQTKYMEERQQDQMRHQQEYNKYLAERDEERRRYRVEREEEQLRYRGEREAEGKRVEEKLASLRIQKEREIAALIAQVSRSSQAGAPSSKSTGASQPSAATPSSPQISAPSSEAVAPLSSRTSMPSSEAGAPLSQVGAPSSSFSAGISLSQVGAPSSSQTSASSPSAPDPSSAASAPSSQVGVPLLQVAAPSSSAATASNIRSSTPVPDTQQPGRSIFKAMLDMKKKANRTNAKAQLSLNKGSSEKERELYEPIQLRTTAAAPDLTGLTEVQRQTALNMLPIIPLLVQELRKGMTNPTTDNSTRKSRKTKSKRAIEAEKDIEQPEERLVILETLRTFLRKKLNYEKNDDWIMHEPVSMEHLAQWTTDPTNAAGPNLENLHLDMRGNISSDWNRRAIFLLQEAFMAEIKDLGMPPRSEEYIEDLLIDQLTRWQKIWRQSQPKVGETLESAEKRIVMDRLILEKSKRHRTRRFNKHARRVNTLEFKLKTTEGEELKCYQFLADLVNRLGTDGMSSEETNVEGMQRLYRVKVLHWRREGVDKYLDVVDAARGNPESGFADQGSKPIARGRDPRNLKSMRDPPKGLPATLYDKNWLDARGNYYAEGVLRVSKEQFEWLDITYNSCGQ